MQVQRRVAGGAARSQAMRAVPRVQGRRTTVRVEARKVALLGAAGGIGQPLAMLLKMNKLVTDLALYDIANVVGVAADLSHCNTPVKVTGYTGADELPNCLKGAELVIIPAGVPRKPGMTRDDLFNVNAGIVQNLVEAIGKHCPQVRLEATTDLHLQFIGPDGSVSGVTSSSRCLGTKKFVAELYTVKAVIAIVTNPVNSTVPIAAEVLKKAGVYDPRKVLGVTTLDVVRANTFVAEAKGLDMKDVDVPVIGGHAGATILPLLSQTTPPVTFSDAEKKTMTEKIQNAGTVVVEAKAGKGSATLSMAYAAARMAESTLLGLNGEPNIYECCFVQSEVVPEVPFFASKVLLGPQGVQKILGTGEMDAFEQQAFQDMLPELKTQIQKGVDFVLKPPAPAASA